MMKFRPALLALCLSAVACGPNAEFEGESRETLGVQVGALGIPCDGNENSFNAVDTIRVCGEGPISLVEGAGTALRTLFDRVLPVSDSMILGDVPVNEEYQLTVIGESEGFPTYYGTKDDVAVSVGATAEVSVQWLPYNSTACASVSAVGKPVHRAFSSGVLLPDGTYFYGGGFTAYLETGDTGEGVLTAASSKTFFFDPGTGKVTSGPDLATGRGAHAMVYVPAVQQVLVIGGVTELDFVPGDLRFPFSMDDPKALNDVEIIDFKTDTPFLTPQSQNSKIELVKSRVFPKAVVSATGNVMVSGGYDWSKDTTNAEINTIAAGFKKIEFLVSVEDDSLTGNSWQLDPQISLKDTDARAGHSFDWVTNEKTQDGKNIEVFLLWGGTRGANKALVIRNTNDGTISNPIQQVPTLEAGGTTVVPTFFHSMTHLGNNRLLALGGVSAGETNELSELLEDQAYLIEYSNPEGNNPTLQISKQPGLNPGRYFHTAQFHRDGSASGFGGFIDFEGNATNEIVAYNQGDSNAITLYSDTQNFPARAGHLSAPLKMGGTYLAAGISTVNDLTVAEEMLSQLLVSPAVDLCKSPLPNPGEGVE